MAIVARFGKQAKRSYGFCIKTSAVAILGLCFILVWSVFSSSYTSVTNQRSTFGEISQPISSSNQNLGKSQIHEFKKDNFESDLEKYEKKRTNGSEPLVKTDSKGNKEGDARVEEDSTKQSEIINEKEEHKISDEPENEELKKENEEGEEEGEKNEEVQRDDDVNSVLDSDGDVANEEDQSSESEGEKKVKKKLGPLFDRSNLEILIKKF